jgi:hypothetical protein
VTPITVTLAKRPEPDAEERRLRALRAREVLNGAGWLFEEYISDLTRDLLGTDPDESEKREQFFHQIDAAAQLRGRLEQIIETQAAHEKVNERKHRNDPPADHE